MEYFVHIGRQIIEQNRAYRKDEPPILVSAYREGRLVHQWRVHKIRFYEGWMETWDGVTPKPGPAVDVWVELTLPFTMVKRRPDGREECCVLLDEEAEAVFELLPRISRGTEHPRPMAGDAGGVEGSGLAG